MKNKNIAIIDADLIGRKRHRFPNVACMKMSAYYKSKGYEVELKTDYSNLEKYYLVKISKVFTDTPIEEKILNLKNVEYGGTGFFYDKAKPLPKEIEHIKPDYTLYENWVLSEIEKGKKRKEFEYYLDYSIGFTTRGCFRKCSFCVNKNSNKVKIHSKIKEFYDPKRKYICLLDDNVFGCSEWKNIFEELNLIGKPFQFKQGLDERLLTKEKGEILSKSKYKGDYIFAFDNIEDKKIIEEKLKLFKKYIDKRIKFYVFCGFDRKDVWNYEFWVKDIEDTFERIKILMKYNALVYIMRFNRYEESPYKGIYITLARWCNQPNFYKKKSFREFCLAHGEKSAPMRYLKEFEKKHKEISKMYFDIKLENIKGDY